MKHTNRKEFCMNFKKYNEMELMMLASIANLTAEDVEDISMEKGDYDAVTMEEYISPFYLTKPNAKTHAMRRKATFKKKVSHTAAARDLGYDLSTERNGKKVKDLLSANHMDRSYMSGDKSFKKHPTIKDEVSMMEKENWEKARSAMMEEHSMILSSVMEDIDTLNMDMKSNEYHIENLETEYKELEEAMKLVAEKLENAKLRKNGIFAALLQKQYEYEKMCNKLMQEMHRFGW